MKFILISILALTYIASKADSQTVSLISLEDPPHVIIDGQFLQEGQIFEGAGTTYKVVKIPDGEVQITDSSGKKQKLKTGDSIAHDWRKPNFLGMTDEEIAKQIQILKEGHLSRVSLYLLVINRSKEEVRNMVGTPNRTTDDAEGKSVWLYYDLTYDSEAERKDSITSITFNKNDTVVNVERQ